MIERFHTATLFALYQMSIVLGILMMPLALALDRVGMTPPVHRVVGALNEALENAQATA